MSNQVDALYFFLIAVSGFFAVLIAVLVVGFAVKFRRRHADHVGASIHGSNALEILWTVIPFFIAMSIFFWGAHIFMVMAKPPADAMEIFVVGKQWMWKIQHMEGRREINELHVPIGQPVRLTMTSEDVIHSFYIPAFRTKMDAVPGRYTGQWFEATKVGEYHLFCAEYCGTNHARMIGRVVVMEPDDYERWLAGDSATTSAVVPMATAGATLFAQKGCPTCHANATGALGPNLEGLFGKEVQLQDGNTVVADEAYVRESILNPQAKVVRGFKPLMPTFKGQLSEEEVLQLIQHVKGLGRGQGEQG